jgi:hypothetical protein
MEHVEAISQAPHPPGSKEIERVRTYILGQLEAMGFSPEIQETTVQNRAKLSFSMPTTTPAQ